MELKSHIQTKKGENNYHYFDKQAIERLLLIQQLTREQGYSLKQIDYYLSTGDDPLKPEANAVNNNDIIKELKGFKEAFEKQEKFNQVLLERLEKQNEYMNESLKKRDEHLMEALEEMRQGRIEAVATEEKKGFWARLFHKE